MDDFSLLTPTLTNAPKAVFAPPLDSAFEPMFEPILEPSIADLQDRDLEDILIEDIAIEDVALDVEETHEPLASGKRTTDLVRMYLLFTR